MMPSKWMTTAVLVTAASLVWVTPAVADQWNDRTILTLSETVRVPGATLQPGTYVFELADPNASSHIVRIRNEKTSKVIATVQAVPIKRTDARNETVLRFNPTEEGAPAALRAWFYPNSTYGHQFVYDEEEARNIANRTKTIVLTMDTPDTEGQSGSLMVYNAAGVKQQYAADAATSREWADWVRNREATAPVVRAEAQGTKVTIDRLEDEASRYIGQKVSVDAEVEDVYGPRLFTIDEPDWGDLEGEIFVFMPAAAAVAVDENDRITVTGTVRPFVLADVEREWGWSDLNQDVLLRLQRRPVLIAERIVGGDNDSVFVIDRTAAPAQASGSNSTSQSTAAGSQSAANSETITQLETIADEEESLVGRRVKLTGVQVRKAGNGGFTARHGDEEVFVLAPPQGSRTLAAGTTVSVEGIVLRTPESINARLDSAGDLSTGEVYIYATNVS
jgi:hypothetical protein